MESLRNAFRKDVLPMSQVNFFRSFVQHLTHWQTKAIKTVLQAKYCKDDAKGSSFKQ